MTQKAITTVEMGAQVARAKAGRLNSILDSEQWLGWLMIAPAILYIVLLIGFPFFLALYYSLSDITVGSRTMHFVGLKNFRP